MPYIKPTSDIFIKYLFGTEESKNLLKAFVNAVMADSGFPLVKYLEIKNPFNLKNCINDKESILDIKAVDVNNYIYNIEVQTDGTGIFKNRSLYYWAKAYSNQLEKGSEYGKLYPVVCVNILDFELFKDIKKDHTTFMVHEHSNPEFVLSEHLRIHFLELPKMPSLNFDRRLSHWLYYLQKEGMEDETMKTLLKENENLAEAHARYESFTYDPELMDAYEARMKWKRDYATAVSEAERRGIDKGIEKEKILFAQKMLEQGSDIEKVVEFTELPIEKVRELSQQLL